mmetsp:Transcript_21124/g.60570  ORF Transcript_21124/g.60570 Transcript_21124/m.60570 type:complete len:217 (+) Transcript_21124:545-1195(+)
MISTSPARRWSSPSSFTLWRTTFTMDISSLGARRTVPPRSALPGPLPRFPASSSTSVTPSALPPSLPARPTSTRPTPTPVTAACCTIPMASPRVRSPVRYGRPSVPSLSVSSQWDFSWSVPASSPSSTPPILRMLPPLSLPRSSWPALGFSVICTSGSLSFSFVRSITLHGRTPRVPIIFGMPDSRDSMIKAMSRDGRPRAMFELWNLRPPPMSRL